MLLYPHTHPNLSPEAWDIDIISDNFLEVINDTTDTANGSQHVVQGASDIVTKVLEAANHGPGFGGQGFVNCAHAREGKSAGGDTKQQHDDLHGTNMGGG